MQQRLATSPPEFLLGLFPARIIFLLSSRVSPPQRPSPGTLPAFGSSTTTAGRSCSPNTPTPPIWPSPSARSGSAGRGARSRSSRRTSMSSTAALDPEAFWRFTASREAHSSAKGKPGRREWVKGHHNAGCHSDGVTVFNNTFSLSSEWQRFRFQPISSWTAAFAVKIFAVFETWNLTVVAGSTDLSGVWRVADPGSLFRTRCMSCGREAANYQSPICAALQGKG